MLTSLHVQVHVLHQMFPSNSSEVEAAYSWKDAFRWLQQIAAALKYLHGLRPMVVHRDLKLENLLLTGSNPGTADAKLADFGLCKLVKVGPQLADFESIQAGSGCSAQCGSVEAGKGRVDWLTWCQGRASIG